MIFVRNSSRGIWYISTKINVRFSIFIFIFLNNLISLGFTPLFLASHFIQKRSRVRVLFRPLVENELLDKPVEQFLTSLRFEQRGKLDQLGIEMGTFE
jgi:hypothetical protein